ncbi:MAG: hypothetical protein RSE41_07695 [Clostridia bacterium]
MVKKITNLVIMLNLCVGLFNMCLGFGEMYFIHDLYEAMFNMICAVISVLVALMVRLYDMTSKF